MASGDANMYVLAWGGTCMCSTMRRTHEVDVMGIRVLVRREKINCAARR